MKIAITGVCGLVGARIAMHLIKQGHEVFGIGRSQCKDMNSQLLNKFIIIDLSSKQVVEELKKAIPTSVELIIHCAAQQPKPGLSFKKYIEGNVGTTENVVEWANTINIKTMISFSTVAFLDLPLEDGILITELEKSNPKNFYALSKWVSESYLRLLEKDTYFTVICLRIPSLVHENQIGGIVHTYWNSAFQNKDLDIYDNGHFRRNLIYIDSIIELVDIILVKFSKYSGFKLYNIGSKDSWTLLEISKYMFEKIGTKAEIFPVNKCSTIQGHWNIDTFKAESELNFSPWSTQRILDTYIKNMRGEGK
jgi:UDP-glucose 4-epimerase